MRHDSKAQANSLTSFLIVLIAVTAIGFIAASGINGFNSSYGTTYSTSGLSSYNNSEDLTSISEDLDTTFNGQNSSTSAGGVLGESFNQVYTLGIVTTRIIGTVTPGIFFNVVSAIGITLNIDPFLVGLINITIVLLLVSYLLYVLLGRQL